MKDQLKEALKRTFRPEFLNRIDDIVIFNQLTQPEIQQIAGKLLDQEVKRLAQAGVQAEYDQAALEHLAQAGFDPVYGIAPGDPGPGGGFGCYGNLGRPAEARGQSADFRRRRHRDHRRSAAEAAGRAAGGGA